MKRIALYLGIAAALVASCSIQEENFETPQQDDVIFYASFEQPSEGTRVYANEDLLLRWTADDRVSIFNKNTYNQQYKFLGKTGDDSGGFGKLDGAEFVIGEPIADIVSVYPYQEGTKIAKDGTLTLTLSSEQHYAENTFGLGANTMVSVSTDNFLEYKNAGGYLMLKLYGEGVSVSSITLKGNNGEKLAGNASVTMPVTGVPSVGMTSDATTEITLVCDTPVQLGATAEESVQFWFVVPPVTFTKGFTVSVTKTSGSVFEKSTSKSITIERNNLSKMSAMEVPFPVPEAIDLGLPSGLKWASFNLGAEAPEEYGDYYAWGETNPKNDYSWTTYMWCMGSNTTMTKYCSKSSYGYNGFTDTKTFLDPEDDVAHVILGGKWWMPTDTDWTELRAKCIWTWTTQNGVKGCLVTGPNGNSIFLPAAGDRDTNLKHVGSYGYYWSSSLNKDTPGGAWRVNFDSGNVNRGSNGRFCGFSVRPVFGNQSVESVSLNKTSLYMAVGETQTLRTTVAPPSAVDKSVTWTSSNTSVATVSSSGDVTAKTIGSATITVKTNAGGKTATCSVAVHEPPKAVDLGLPSGLKWASFNIGASKPEGYGSHIAWGEMSSKSGWDGYSSVAYYYSWSNYKWCKGSNKTLTKYCSKSSYGYNGFTDTKTVLDPEDDVAHVKWGGSWRMPTDTDWTELRAKCTWTWTTQNGTKGCLVTGPNGNSIFLPAAGFREYSNFYKAGSGGYYWSSSLRADEPDSAWYVYFNSGNVGRYGNSYRYSGQSVRPVCD